MGGGVRSGGGAGDNWKYVLYDSIVNKSCFWGRGLKFVAIKGYLR